jgi:class 3 adenylate cyclase/DNA-binding NarL/FixJ family response regulator
MQECLAVSMQDDDSLLLEDDEAGVGGPIPGVDRARGAPPASRLPPWRVLVVDDDADVLLMSRVALRGVLLDDAPVDLVCVGSAQEARRLFESGAHFGAVLLDVVMERDTAGLDLVRWIRANVADTSVRIILRTGQPGTAPEASVMGAYDIHDYLSKSDTTARRLVTCVLGALRAYRDVRTIQGQRAGMRGVVDAVTALFSRSGGSAEGGTPAEPPRSASPDDAVAPSVEVLAHDVVVHLTALLSARAARVALFFRAGGQAVRLAGAADVECPPVLPPVGEAAREGARWTHALDLGAAAPLYLVVAAQELAPWDLELAQVYCGAATLAFRNASLLDAQRSWVRTLERFVPRELGRLVGREDLRALTPGECATHELSVCFVDVRGFSARTARVGGFAAFRMLNELFARLAEVVAAHGGIIDKYLGDGMLVLFPGAPERAMDAARDLQRGVRAFSCSTCGDEPLRIGIGLHWGEVVVGAVGHRDRVDLSVVSSVVNMAARVQELSRHVACDILVTDDLVARLPEAARTDVRPVLLHHLRGDDRPRRLWEAYGHHDEAQRALRRAPSDILAQATDAAAREAWDVAAGLLAGVAAEHREDPTVQALIAYADGERRARTRP